MRTPVLVLATALTLAPAACTIGSGTPSLDTRDVTGFDAIDVGGAFQVSVAVGPPADLELRGDDNVLPEVRAEVRGSTLHLSLPGRVVTKLPLEAIITVPSLVSLDASGAATVTVNGFADDGKHLEVDASGASRVLLYGILDRLDAEVSGASTLDAQGLWATQAHVDASGASKVDVLVSSSLHAEASGASTIRHHGTPTQLDREVSGSSTIELVELGPE
jgi:hypothetical protein